MDTNVLISAVLFGGHPGRVLDAARTGVIEGVVSLHVLQEFRHVLSRPRFGLDLEAIDVIIEEIAAVCDVSPIERAIGSWSADPDDDPVIEAAIEARVHYVVTGDAHLLAMEWPGISFITPARFVEWASESC